MMIIKLLNNKINSSSYIELFKIHVLIESKGFASIDDFRLLISLLPGLTTSLTSVTGLHIVDSLQLVKAGWLRFKNYEKLIEDYATRFH